MGTCRWASSVIVALPYPALFCCHARRHSAPHFSALRIASCSQDGDVIVWTQDAAGKWSSVLLNHFSSPVWRVSWSISGWVLDRFKALTVPSFFESFLGTFLLLPPEMGRCLFGSRAQTAFGGISIRSTIPINDRDVSLMSQISLHLIEKSAILMNKTLISFI